MGAASRATGKLTSGGGAGYQSYREYSNQAHLKPNMNAGEAIDLVRKYGGTGANYDKSRGSVLDKLRNSTISGQNKYSVAGSGSSYSRGYAAGSYAATTTPGGTSRREAPAMQANSSGGFS